MTYKVTYYNAQMEIESVQTYHNIGGDAVAGIVILTHMRAHKCPFVQALEIIEDDEYRNLTDGFYYVYSEEIQSIYNEIFAETVANNNRINPTMMEQAKVKKAIESVNYMLEYSKEGLIIAELFRLKDMLAKELHISVCTHGEFNMYDFVSKDKFRPVLSGVYHDAEKQVAVATDTRVMVWSKKDYKPEFAGKIIDKNGAEIVGRYPNWNAVIPDFSGKDTVTVHFTAEQIAEAEKNFELLPKSEQKETGAKVNATEQTGTHTIKPCGGESTYNISFYTKYLKLLLKNGVTELQGIKNSNNAFMASGKDFEALLMPCLI